MKKQQITITVPEVNLHSIWQFTQKWILPNPGTLALMLILVLTVPAIARTTQSSAATSLSTIPYQGRLADASGNPITDRQNMEFRLYDTPVGGTPLWTEFWTGGNSVNVSDGLFSVMLGSINTQTPLASVVQGNDQLYLGITVGTDTEMAPRVQLGSVPFSMISLTVPDGSVTEAKIAEGSVTSSKVALDHQHYHTWLSGQSNQSGVVPITDPFYQPLTITTTVPTTLDITLTVSACGDRVQVPVYVDDVEVGGPMAAVPCEASYKTTSLTYRTLVSVGPGSHTVSARLGAVDNTTVWIHGMFALTVVALGQ